MAKASLISNKSTSFTFQPALSNNLFIAPTGAIVNSAGFCACVVCATTLQSGVKPRAFAVDNFIITNAAAPSEIELELAAVIVPSFLNAALSEGILSGRALPGCSSVSMVTSLRRLTKVTGAISFLNAPDSIASFARDNDLIANSSICSRVKLVSSAVS